MLFSLSCNFFQRPSSLTRISLQCWKFHSTSFLRRSIRFTSRDGGLYGSTMIAWSLNHLIVDMFWVVITLEHPLLFFLLRNFITDMLRMSCKMLRWCLLFDFLSFMVNSPMHSQLTQSQTTMLPHSCFTIVLTTRLFRVSPHLFRYHCWPSRPTMLNLLSYENTTSLDCSSIQSLCSFVLSYLNCLWQSETRGFFIYLLLSDQLAILS